MASASVISLRIRSALQLPEHGWVEGEPPPPRATSQWYINLVNNTALDHRGYSPEDFGYAVFGRVLHGMDVVDKIAATPTASSGPHDDVPVTPVVIHKVTVK